MPKRFVIVMMARSGSTWLITLLNGQPGVAANEELFLPHPVKPQYAWLAEGAPDRFIVRRPSLPGPRPRQIARYLSEIESHDPNARAAGFKINAVQARGMPELLPILALRGYRLITLTRENVFDSSVSQIVAKTTGVAHSRSKNDGGPPELAIDPGALVQRMRRRLRWNAGLGTLARIWPLPSIWLSYEALVADQSEALGRALKTIGLDDDPTPVESQLHRRIDRPYSETISNYVDVLAAVQAAGLGRFAPHLTTVG